MTIFELLSSFFELFDLFFQCFDDILIDFHLLAGHFFMICISLLSLLQVDTFLLLL